MRAAKWITRRVGLSVISSSAVDFLSLDNPFSSERARRELGWSPSVRPEVGIPDAFRWWKESREEMKRARR
jgi:nucleoside-diphosphate-sugar epimerase